MELPGSMPAEGDEEGAASDAALHASLWDTDNDDRASVVGGVEAEVSRDSALAADGRRASAPVSCTATVGGSRFSVSADIAESFGPRRWLSDASISKAYSIMGGPRGIATSHPQYKEGLPPEVILLDPAAAFWLTAQDDPRYVEEARRELKIESCELMLCPVNDCRDSGHSDGGTHWTLLVWDRSRSSEGHGRFRYYDSLNLGLRPDRTTGFRRAEALATRLNGGIEPAQVCIGRCARQTNSFDCGVYVLHFSEIIARAYLEAQGTGDRDVVIEGAGVASRSSKRSAASAPAWEERLLCVTPAEVASKRSAYFALFGASAV